MDRLKNKKIGIFIFRRDLRLTDNIGLLNLQNEVDIIIPIFILDKYQIKKSSHNAHYFSG
jgi:deoxyribodipyrimidine photolyase